MTAAHDIDDLAGRLSDSRLITDPDLIEGYRRDEAHAVAPGTPIAVLMAGSTDDVVHAMRWADATRTSVVPRGAGTGLSGGATAVDGCLIVCTARMTEIRELAADDHYAIAEAGVINADLDRAAGQHGLMYAPDPSSFETSTIGGNVATNAGGLRCVKYGVTRDSVLGVEAVLADGRILRTGRRTVKGVAGYDLTGLLVGSEGTLGIITAATLRLRPRPVHPPVTVLGSFASMSAAGAAVAATFRRGAAPSLMELIDRATLHAIADWKGMQLDGDPAAVLIGQADGRDAPEAAEAMRTEFLAAGAQFADISTDPAEAAQLLEIRRLAYPAAERLGSCLVEDVGVPRSKLPDLFDAIERAAAVHDVTILTVAHAGDGNAHPTFVFDRSHGGRVPPQVWAAADEVFRAALDLGGTLTGEHGVGALKRRWIGLELGDDALDVHRAIKSALDPHGILNPGKAF